MNVETSQAGRLYWKQNNEPDAVLENLFSKIRSVFLVLMTFPPWDFWLKYLTFCFGDGAKKKFSQVQHLGRGLEGFIIGKWNEREELIEYVEYLHVIEEFVSFDDETKTMNPLMYRTLRGAMGAIDKLRGKGQERIGLAVWSHPESIDIQLGEYLRLSGHRFPGSPRQ